MIVERVYNPTSLTVDYVAYQELVIWRGNWHSKKELVSSIRVVARRDAALGWMARNKAIDAMENYISLILSGPLRHWKVEQISDTTMTVNPIDPSAPRRKYKYH